MSSYSSTRHTHSSTDQELIEAAKEGNQQAFHELVVRYESQMAKTIIGMVGPGDEADDIGQEVFIRFYKSMHRFRGDASLGTYLTQIAINLSLNALKKRKRRRMFQLYSEHEEAIAGKLEANDLTEAQRADQQLVHKALQGLPAQFRSIIVLRMLDGYSTKEVAEMLDLPIGTVLSRLARGQKKLKKIIEQLDA